jgi:hypothetical protein
MNCSGGQQQRSNLYGCHRRSQVDRALIRRREDEHAGICIDPCERFGIDAKESATCAA